MEINQFKIFDIVSSHKDDASYWHIDFKRDLKPDKALSKTVTFAINGRPQASTYTYNGVEMARIRWTFTNFPNSFLMMTRREEISYVLLDGTDGPWFLRMIKHIILMTHRIGTKFLMSAFLVESLYLTILRALL